jgi:hypothetical protein
VNIRWENLDITYMESFLRKLYINFIMLLVLIGSFILLFYTSALSKEGNLSCPAITFASKDDVTSSDVKNIDQEN